MLKLVAKLVIVITAWGRSLVPVVWTQIRPNATIVGVRQLGSHRRRNSSELHQWCCRDRKLPEACPAFVSTFCQFLNKSLAMECRERRPNLDSAPSFPSNTFKTIGAKEAQAYAQGTSQTSISCNNQVQMHPCVPNFDVCFESAHRDLTKTCGSATALS